MREPGGFRLRRRGTSRPAGEDEADEADEAADAQEAPGGAGLPGGAPHASRLEAGALVRVTSRAPPAGQPASRQAK